ncbi:MAG: sensor histidine kinase [Roseivirga sp.]|nr:sensor histidine kinase [Roseivirga sp.]
MSFSWEFQSPDKNGHELEVSYIVDQSDTLSLDDVQNTSIQNRFDESPLTISNLGYTPHTHWFRVVVKGDLQNETYKLELGHPILQFISLYKKNTLGEWQESRGGHGYNAGIKENTALNFVFDVSPTNANRIIYLKVKTSSSFTIPLSLRTVKGQQRFDMTRNIFLGVFFGIMTIMVLYNLMLYLFLKDRAYLFYVLATLFGILTSMVSNGIAYNYVWNNAPHLDGHMFLTFAGLSMVFSSRFASDFLNLKELSKNIHRYVWLITFLSTVMVVLSWFLTELQLLAFAQLLVLIAFPSYFFIGLKAYRKGYRPALFYLIAWVPYITGLVLVTAQGAGWIPSTIITSYGIEIGGALEAVLLSLALANRIGVMRKELANKELEKVQFETKLLQDQKVILEQQVNERTSELTEANATKDKFFSIIAHDLRSPMIGLQGVGQKLEYFIKKNRQEKLLEIGGQIDQSIDQLNHLLNNLLNWATSQTGGIPHHPESFTLREVVEQNMELYQSLAQSKEVQLINNTGHLSIYADLNTTSTIIRNLLSNAIKFTAPDSAVTVDACQEGSLTVIAITDQGPGMDEATLQSIFSDKAKSEAGSKGEKGFGLGLKLCREFAEMNGGTITVENNQSRGTTFKVCLPGEAKETV